MPSTISQIPSKSTDSSEPRPLAKEPGESATDKKDPERTPPEIELESTAYPLMQKVPTNEEIYSEEHGYGKKERDSSVTLAVRRAVAKIGPELEGAARRVEGVLTRPWGGGGGEERRRIELGWGLLEIREGVDETGIGSEEAESEDGGGGGGEKKVGGRLGDCCGCC